MPGRWLDCVIIETARRIPARTSDLNTATTATLFTSTRTVDLCRASLTRWRPLHRRPSDLHRVAIAGQQIIQHFGRTLVGVLENS